MYTRTVNFASEVDATILPAHLANCLRQINARTVRIEGNSVSFTGGVFGAGSKWDVLVPFGFGELSIDSNSCQLRYRLSLRQLAVGAAVLVAFIVGFGLSFSQFRWPDGLTVGIIGWVWLVGLNLFIGLHRFQKFVLGAIDTAPRIN